MSSNGDLGMATQPPQLRSSERVVTAGVLRGIRDQFHDQPIAMRDLIFRLEQETGKTAQLDRQPAFASDLPITHADLTKARMLLGYQPRVAFSEGIREYVTWHIAYGGSS